MSLQKKIIHLRLRAALAEQVAATWQKAIDTHGEDKATAFYTHLGLNHLEKKSFDYEGLMLSREPKEHEKIAVKGIHAAQESAKESIGKILLELRSDLIKNGLKRIQKLKPATYHELILETPSATALTLKERLLTVHHQGRMLVAAELGKKAALPDEDEFDELDDLTDLTGSRVVNDVQSRLIASMQRFTMAGLNGTELITAVTNDINGGSVAYVDRTATGLANKVINIGRSDEAQSRSDEWERVEYSALLDANVCEPCASFDGESATNEDDLEPAPSPSCLGGDFCRCFHVFIAD